MNTLVYCLALCSSSCGFIVPRPAVAAAALLAAPEGSAQPPVRGVSHFTLQRWSNNVAAHQRAEQSQRDAGGEDDCRPHGRWGRPWGAGPCCSPAGPAEPLASSVHPWLPTELGAQLLLCDCAGLCAPAEIRGVPGDMLSARLKAAPG